MTRNKKQKENKRNKLRKGRKKDDVKYRTKIRIGKHKETTNRKDTSKCRKEIDQS
jgi:hypothetical protein